MAYDWPGNVRQLRNCLEHMMALATSNSLGLRDLPDVIASAVADTARTPDENPHFAPAERRFLRNIERDVILNTLAETNGSRELTANILGIGRTTLYRKMKGYNCSRSLPSVAPTIAKCAAA